MFDILLGADGDLAIADVLINTELLSVMIRTTGYIGHSVLVLACRVPAGFIQYLGTLEEGVADDKDLVHGRFHGALEAGTGTRLEERVLKDVDLDAVPNKMAKRFR